MKARSSVSSGPETKIVVVGAGNIGSHVVPLLGRFPGVTQVLVVDFDSFESRNLSAQNILPGDAGKPKAEVMASMLRRVNPQLTVRAACERVELMPLGALRCDVLIACLDSRQARRTVNRVAWRLGIPWIDAAVDQTGMLARVNVFKPAPAAPCIECAWEARDYELLSQEFSCSGALQVPATNATAGLGALAAALQILELHKLLDHDGVQTAGGTQFLIDARHHASLRSVVRRNSACRFDHRTWEIKQMAAPRAVSLVDGFAALGDVADARMADCAMRLEGMTFLTALWCPACERRKTITHVEGRLASHALVCPRCGGAYVVIERNDRLVPGALSTARCSTPLHRLGLRCGDVATLASGDRETHVQFGSAEHGEAA